MRVLVTGGSGSFGQAFLRSLLAERLAEKIVVYSRSEHRQAELREALGHPPEVRWLIGDVRDPERLYDALHRVDTVVHAAALKRVEDQDPRELMLTNYQGTVNVVRAAVARNVPRILLLSSDKAAAPSTHYGVSKAAAEAYALYANRYGQPQVAISAMRYGNVLGSQGSVIHRWRAQARRGLPLTLTDAKATRFILTLGEAVAFVSLALRRMHGGEIFVPKLPAAWLGDLAEAVAPGHRIAALPWRAGEKHHEVLISGDESGRAVWFNALDGWLLHPADPGWAYDRTRTLGVGSPLAEGVEVCSAGARRLSVAELRQMLKAVPS